MSAVRTSPEHKKRLYDESLRKFKERYRSDPAFRELMADRNRRRFGLKLGEYKVLFEAQNVLCKTCNRPQQSRKTKNLYVDHNHSTGKVRGLLCNKCNVALGQVEDNIQVLENMIIYLKNHQ